MLTRRTDEVISRYFEEEQRRRQPLSGRTPGFLYSGVPWNVFFPPLPEAMFGPKADASALLRLPPFLVSRPLLELLRTVHVEGLVGRVLDEPAQLGVAAIAHRDLAQRPIEPEVGKGSGDEHRKRRGEVP